MQIKFKLRTIAATCGPARRHGRPWRRSHCSSSSDLSSRISRPWSIGYQLGSRRRLSDDRKRGYGRSSVLTTVDAMNETVIADTGESTPDALAMDASLSPASYPTTLSVILLMHILFLNQWNSRIRRKRVLASYRVIIRQRKFYRLWIALLSHPPVADERYHANEFIPLEETIPQEATTHDVITRLRTLQQQFVSISTKGSWSGFPLLLYNSHILWSCRALEGRYGSLYVYVLLSLAALAVALELLIYRRVLDGTRAALAVGYEDISLPTERILEIQEGVQKRPLGSLTVLTTALLLVFSVQFPYVPIQILPWIGNLFISDPGVSLLLSLGILTYLSHQTHSVFGVVFGIVASSLWNFMGLDFLGDAYWGRWMALMLLTMTMLSLHEWLPCVDRVSSPSNPSVLLSRDGLLEEMDDSDDDSEDDESSTSSNWSEWDGYERHEVDQGLSIIPEPFDSDSDVEMQPLTRFTTMRSRRGNAH